MRVLLIQPPIQDFYRTRFREYPLGLLYLGASLKNHGHKVHIMDARYTEKPKKIATPPELAYLNTYYTKENNLFIHYKHFGISCKEMQRDASKINPDVVAINSMFTPYIMSTIETAKAIKEVLPHVLIIVGGHHATADPKSLSKNSYIDCVVTGEGELILPKILEHGIRTRIYPDDKGETPIVDNLDDLPLPARDMIPTNLYRYGKKRYTMLTTSRGCPHRCSFCSVHTLCGHRHRTHEINRVMAELEECVERHRIEVIDLQDDNLLFDRERIKVILSEIISRYEKRNIEFLASNGLNVAHMDTELLKMMKKAGFKKLDLALATSHVPFRKNIRRPETVEQYEKILNTAVKIGFSVTTYIILGLPTQPIGEMKETINYLKTKPTLIAPSIFYNVPGMPIFEESRRYEYRSTHTARRSSAFNNFGDDFTRDDIFELFKEIRRHNLSLFSN